MNRHSSAPAPIRHQYLRIKQHYPDAILLFRLGDFYETFEEDARIASRELGITLTSREMGKGQHFPMAGIPHHALDNYLGKLIGRGYKVAICEQISDPTASRGLVDRDVVRVVTPGTVVEPQLLEQKANNYLAALVLDEKGAGLAYVDITTSEFSTTQLAQGQVQAEMERLRPSEVLVPKDVRFPETWLTGTRTFLDKSWFEPESARQLLLEHFGASTLEGFGCEGLPLATAAAGAIVHYLQETQKGALGQLTRLSTYSTQAFMTLDPQTRRNLELFQSSSLVSPANSLLSVLDITRTPMGGRLLRKWLGQPLLDLQELGKRQEAVEWFYKRAIPRTGVLSALSRIPDLERLVNRIKGRIAIHKEVLALRRGLEMLPELEGMLKEKGEADSPDISWLTREVKPCNDIVALISKAIADEAPASIGEGAVIKAGFSEELDSLKAASRNAAEYIAGLERKERESTGIKSLKVGYNKVFGYYIEVSKPNLSQVPKEYIRKQTLVNGERFFTPELKEYESLILNARERIEELETALFRQVCFQIETSAERILTTASALAHIDAFSALAEVASRHSYVRPTLTRDDTISIIGGRHPVVEKALPQGEFAPNDTHLSNKDTQIVILTGPNMSGKSTYLRQVALIVLMAQIGSFVPAESATIGIVDRIFTRVGLQDDLTTGRSTFMVEMLETAQILNNATSRSLIILDEIGRGTSTYDGLSIARAVAEYIHNNPRLGCKTLFATHYHELVELAQVLPRVRNYNVAVAEEGKKVIFLHRIVPGGADKSYGIHVAQLAGLPRPVIGRAQEVLTQLEADSRRTKPSPRGKKHIETPPEQTPLFAPTPEVIDELLRLDVSSMTPLEAITKLYELQKKAREGN